MIAMENYIKKENPEIDLSRFWHDRTNILELKNWIEYQISQGKTTISCNVEWGYYSDIDAIILKAE